LSVLCQLLPVCFPLLRCGAVAGGDPPESPAEKFRKALEQSKELEVSGQPLERAVDSLARQTGIPFQVDPALRNSGVFALQPSLLTIRPIKQPVAAALS